MWYGALYSDEIPNREIFFEDWEKYYFQDLQNRKGRCFHILQDSNRIGQVNYNAIKDNQVDIDILIYDKENWSKGFGTSAIKLICAYLEEKYHVDQVWIDVHPENTRAIKAYSKAGFIEQTIKELEGVEYCRLSRKNQYL